MSRILVALLALSTLHVHAFAGQAEPPVVGRDAGSSRSIQGIVLLKNGSPVAGAAVLLKDMKTLQIRSYIASSEGKYAFHGLSSDINYQIRAAANGMTSKTKRVSVFDSRKVVKLDLKLTKEIKK